MSWNQRCMIGVIGMLISIVTIIFIHPANASAGSLFGETALDKALKEGTFDAEIGLYYGVIDPDHGDHGALLTTFLEMSYESAPLNGFQFGVGVFGVTDIHEDEAFPFPPDNDQASHTGGIKEGYIKYTIPETKSSFLIGRTNMVDTLPTLVGDAHDGIMFTSTYFKKVSINAGIITSYVEYFDAEQAVSEHVEMDELTDESGNAVFTLSTTIDFGVVELTPFIGYHKDNDNGFGLLFAANTEIIESLTIGVEGNWSKYNEDTEDSISDTDQDWSNYLISSYINNEMFSLACGYWATSDDESVGQSIILDNFSPMEELEDAWQDHHLWFVEVGVSIDPVELSLIYGDLTDDFDNGANDAREITFIAAVDIFENMSFEAVCSDVSYDNASGNDYTKYSLEIVYTF
ncbi:MAG: hypothetical protein GY707_12230 [Desulfobacteraceae bacterium]|nr:hypothetical protein [Desulfobacteraceae bacterium]